MMNNVFRSFPVTIPIQPEESLLGYLFRVAHRQGLKRLKNLYQVSGYCAVHPRFYGLDIRPLAFVLGQSAIDLLKMNYNSSNGDPCKEPTWFRHHHLNAWKINQSRPKLCLSCMREKLFLPDLWELTFYVSCVHHDEILTRNCPSCGDGLKWTRPGILKCHCGHDLTNDGQEPADESVRSMVKLIASSLGTLPRDPSQSYHEEILLLGPDDLMRLVGLVGLTASGRYGFPVRGIRSLTIEEQVGLLKKAHHVLSDWPHNFQKFLEQIMGMEKVKKPGSFRQEMFGSFYTRLAYTRHQNFKFVLDQLAIFENKRHAIQDQVVPPETVKITELGHAKTQLKISPEAILKSSINGGLVLFRERRYRVPSRIVVAQVSLKRFKRRAANRLSYSDGCKLLGVGQKPMDSLLHSESLTKDFRTVLDGRADYSLIKTECLKILKNINLCARPLSKLPDGARTVDFTRLLATYSSRDLPVKLFLDLVLDGEINVYCEKRDGNFKDFLFLTADIREFVTAYLRGEEDLLTYADIDREFRLGESMVRQLLSHDKIEDKKIKIGGRVFQFVPRESLEKWLTDYVTLKQIQGSYYGMRNETLERIGIRPVLRPERLGGAHWYRRKDVL